MTTIINSWRAVIHQSPPVCPGTFLNQHLYPYVFNFKISRGKLCGKKNWCYHDTVPKIENTILHQWGVNITFTVFLFKRTVTHIQMHANDHYQGKALCGQGRIWDMGINVLVFRAVTFSTNGLWILNDTDVWTSDKMWKLVCLCLSGQPHQHFCCWLWLLLCLSKFNIFIVHIKLFLLHGTKENWKLICTKVHFVCLWQILKPPGFPGQQGVPHISV